MKKIIKALAVVLSFVMILTVIAPVSNIQAATIKLNCTKKTIYVGDSFKLKVSGVNGKIKWISYNSNVAKVNKNGKVTGISAGKTEIHAKYKNINKKCIITVKDKDYSAGIKYEYVEIGNNSFIKVTNSNDVDVCVPIRLKQIDNDGFTQKNFKNDICVYKNDTTYYYIGSSEYSGYDSSRLTLNIEGITKEVKNLQRVDLSTNMYTKQEERTDMVRLETVKYYETVKYCDLIAKNDSKKDVKYYRFVVLGKDSNGNYITSHISEISVPAESKIKNTFRYDGDVQSFDIFLFEPY